MPSEGENAFLQDRVRDLERALVEATEKPELSPETDLTAEATKLEKEAEAEERIAKARARIEAAKKALPVDAQMGSRDVFQREPDVDRSLGEVSSAFAPGVQRLLREQANQGRYKIDHATMKVR